ncbi:hypothetical protein CEUSTIGMA_g11289.t1 [Chlamydomonas eustigma]|uniref:Uncharacterized protein n=1 Tax=Chlamydomonas eustigma TaxID=1157962 RepID=A0A250XLB2_9CHLO|nr:hypothetical protein CEUSTIGMA_g11289.t1 [Chlamydomonas eustigma]|eukprot:GAX83864.1 hypothetical protein CEUSTIGMA_g11289.t1 [Chlamydomonas eustigma]
MDEEPPMGMLTAQVYKGPASIPHASGDFFAAFFLASNTVLLAHMFPGRVFGSELRPRKYDPDYIASCCNEAGMRRQALAGQVPRQWLLGGGPRDVTDSWEHMWWDNLHWKRWKIARTGPAFPQDMYWQ